MITESKLLRNAPICICLLMINVFTTISEAQTCRALEQEIVYSYDPSHQYYPYSTVVLGVQHSGRESSVVISREIKHKGRIQSQYLESPDSGRHWHALNSKEYATNFAFGGDLLVAAPSDSRFQYKYVDKHAAYAKSMDRGRTWHMPRNMINGMTLAAFTKKVGGSTRYHMRFAIAAIHPSSPRVMFATLRLESNKWGPPINVGLFKSSDGADHWNKVTDVIAFGTPLGINPSNPSEMFGYGVVGYLGVVKTINAGVTWLLTRQQKYMEQEPIVQSDRHGNTYLGFPVGINVHQFVIDPHTVNTVYLVSTKGVYRTYDGGGKWCILKIGQDLIDSTYSLSLDPHDTHKMYVGTRFGLYFSVDQGEHFERIYPGTLR